MVKELVEKVLFTFCPTCKGQRIVGERNIGKRHIELKSIPCETCHGRGTITELKMIPKYQVDQLGESNDPD